MSKRRGDEAPRAAAPSFEYRLNRTPVGVVMLDAELEIRSVNPVALRLLAPSGAEIFGANILDLHPEEARDKVGWLISRAATGPEGTASLVVTTAMGSLVAKVSRLDGAGGAIEGYCMMIHALVDAPVMGRAESEPADERTEAVPVAAEAGLPLCPLLKLPLMRGKGAVISLIDVSEVACLVAEGHYAEARTLSFSAFCPRSLADLERRLDPSTFLRVHRRFLVNIRHVRGAERTDGGWHLILADRAATRVPVSRAKVEVMRRMLAV